MKIIVSAFSNLSTDQRIEKICKTLHEAGYNVHLIGCTWGECLPIERPYFVEKISIRAKSLKLAYPEFNLRLAKKLNKLADRNCIFYCNDLDALFANKYISRKKRIPLIFDSHEIFTEMPAIQGRFTQKIWRLLERNIVPGLRYMITASECYAHWFVQRYGISKPVVVQNFPYRGFSFEHEKDEKEKIILYQGVLNPSRGLDKVLKSMNLIPNAILNIAGDGPEKENLLRMVSELKIEDRVVFLGKLVPEELRKVTPNADLGLSIEENNGLSYYFSLPNKISDYIQAGVPLVTSDFPEMRKIIRHFKIGECIENHSPEELSRKINKVLSRGKLYYRDNLYRAAHDICWENETPKLLALVRRIEKENFG